MSKVLAQRLYLLSGFVLLCWLLPFAIGQTPAPKAAQQSSGPEQPIPYSHKKHLALGVTCENCHKAPDPGDQETLPATQVCMTCHSTIKKDSPEIQKLARFNSDKEEVPWVRVYALPDFVYFSHKTHLDSKKANCETCHGRVREMDVMRVQMDMSMAACMECHRKNDAPVECTTCHELQ